MLPTFNRWEQRPVCDEDASRLAMELKCPYVFARLLMSRGIADAVDAQAFLNPDENKLYDPMLMKGMKEAVEVICDAVRRDEKITIYGDYDVDGITATSILYLFFSEIGADIHYYLPERLTEGYGLNEQAVRGIAENGTRLMITVDTGITAVKECSLAREMGMKVVVTDHHECMPSLPDCEAIVDAKQPGETYPYLYLAGCGVAFKLVQALGEALNDQGDIYPYLELAALGTVADIVPLQDENRIIVKCGIRRMMNPVNMGLKKLLETSGYAFNKKIKAGFIAFSLAPRLNAGGRMGDAERGVRLFTTTDEWEAAAIARELDLENTARKETEQLILEQVVQKIESDEALRNNYVYVVSGERWHHGVIGIVSSRIKESYYRPNIILTIENGIATGSARSIDGFNLFEALKTCDDLMIKYGGHAAAAGMTLREENIPELTRRLNDYAKSILDSRLLTPVLDTDLELTPSQVTVELAELMNKMEPYGQSMPEPVVTVQGYIDRIDLLGKDQNTLRVSLVSEGRAVKVIGFRSGHFRPFYTAGMRVRIAGNLGINEFNGHVEPQIMMKDLSVSLTEGQQALLQAYALRHVTNDYEAYCSRMPRSSRQICSQVYKVLMGRCKALGNAREADMMLANVPLVTDEPEEVRLFHMLQALTVFEELGLIRMETSGVCLHYELTDLKNVKLTESAWFNQYFS